MFFISVYFLNYIKLVFEYKEVGVFFVVFFFLIFDFFLFVFWGFFFPPMLQCNKPLKKKKKACIISDQSSYLKGL